ncbi:MAG: DUF305 domain-containing protein [Hyphomicrobium sp.]|jgi:uncharacterized protein (DUF305 family)|nr:DUF305 domain-containing protein [Hyphomicrobium sp.]
MKLQFRSQFRSLAVCLSASLIAGLLATAGARAADDHHGHHAPDMSQPFVASSDVPFDKAMDETMARMHAGMAAAKPTGNPDRDFLTMMIPHHQGAIDMAKVILLHTKDPAMRNLAQSIITEQTSEIELMNGMLKASPEATKK